MTIREHSLWQHSKPQLTDCVVRDTLSGSLLDMLLAQLKYDCIFSRLHEAESFACKNVHEFFVDVFPTREDFLYSGNGGADGKFSIEANLLPSLSWGKEGLCGCHVFLLESILNKLALRCCYPETVVTLVVAPVDVLFTLPPLIGPAVHVLYKKSMFVFLDVIKSRLSSLSIINMTFFQAYYQCISQRDEF